MHAANIPTIASAGHTHTFYGGGDWVNGTTASTSTSIFNQLTNQGCLAAGNANIDALFGNQGHQRQQKQESAMPSRRLVQVIIIDPNENVPLSDCMLFKGEEKLTDATDQELFFELDIKGILDAHNAKRVKMIDKKVKDRTEYLEPVKIRELKMVVVNIATF